MMFAKQPVEMTHSKVFLRGEELAIVKEFTYLGVTLDSVLTFKSHVKKLSNIVKFNLKNFKHIRPFLTVDATRLYLYSMVFSHIEYCFNSWSFISDTTLKTIESLYKKAIKVLDKKKPCHFIVVIF